MASDPPEPVTAPRLRTPRAAAVAGIAFSLLLAAVFVLLIVSVPPDTGTLGSWLTDSGRRTEASRGSMTTICRSLHKPFNLLWLHAEFVL